MDRDFQSDIEAIGSITSVPTILDVVCRTTGMGFAAVARVTESRWIACEVLDTISFGLRPGGELKLETTICHEIRQNREPVVINNVANDPAYCNHHTPALYGFQSYISIPIIRRDGRFFGTLCAIDPRPARLDNPETIGMFKLFAELIASHLDSSEQLAVAQSELSQERQFSELREQFIAVLGHDLRNPIAAIDAGTKLLLRTALEDKARQIVALMQGSVMRMRDLVNNVLDFARTRMGDGLVLDLAAGKSLQPVLEQVVGELRAVYPDKTVETDFALHEGVDCDEGRIAQLVSNLLSNALTHGEDNAPVRLNAATRHGMFELWVSNKGIVIPVEAIPNLFQPFFRGTISSNQQGLGLGLYIASEIAQAHGGELKVYSDVEETRFTFLMPLHLMQKPARIL